MLASLVNFMGKRENPSNFCSWTEIQTITVLHLTSLAVHRAQQKFAPLP